MTLHSFVCVCAHRKHAQRVAEKKPLTGYEYIYFKGRESALFSVRGTACTAMTNVVVLTCDSLEENASVCKTFKIHKPVQQIRLFFSFYQLFSVNQLMKRLQDSQVFAFSCFFARWMMVPIYHLAHDNLRSPLLAPSSVDNRRTGLLSTGATGESVSGDRLHCDWEHFSWNWDPATVTKQRAPVFIWCACMYLGKRLYSIRL